ncbi:uncharacterized protein HMPREF1541_06169 [Cyphellophora europaea CBS 101466]|uniref:N-acetyltransferase domain-containing protein n=1 Tax=Cyphellophora europaea (strain CBS 101466) TaxID=1220924 RepID=W2RU44_CYPE1|nr:uncharacterized protein HMPREF1541_06169 [Cyphellophora europaea CBS 101466]ETN39942.1 hypothetical protein HMPREF1541_06169 [Cyphellophora europaea CBS 101466]
MATATTALHMLALRLERADALHLAAQIHALNTLAPHTTSSTPQPSPTATTPTATPLAGGYILTSAPQYTHKLNRASGLAMLSPLTPSILDSVESLFAPTGLPPKIDLCPLAPHAEAALTLLRQRGYVDRGGIEMFYIDLPAKKGPLREEAEGREVLKPSPSPPPPQRRSTAPGVGEVEVRCVRPDEVSRFVQASVAGFRSNGRAPELLETLARIAVARRDTMLYFALVDGKVAGSAGMLILHGSQGGDDGVAGEGGFGSSDGGAIAQLYIDSTLPAYRGYGIHGALIRERLKEAWEAGCVGVMLSAREGSASGRNAKREGFRAVYVKRSMFKEKKNISSPRCHESGSTTYVSELGWLDVEPEN